MRELLATPISGESRGANPSGKYPAYILQIKYKQECSEKHTGNTRETYGINMGKKVESQTMFIEN